MIVAATSRLIQDGVGSERISYNRPGYRGREDERESQDRDGQDFIHIIVLLRHDRKKKRKEDKKKKDNKILILFGSVGLFTPSTAHFSSPTPSPLSLQSHAPTTKQPALYMPRQGIITEKNNPTRHATPASKCPSFFRSSFFCNLLKKGMDAYY